MSTRLSPERYLQHLESESARFREVIEPLPTGVRVPSCPDWDADDLLWHLATVQRHWAAVVAARPAGPDQLDDSEPARPAARTELLLAFDRWSGQLLDVLAAAPATDEAWNWSQDHTVGFILRRQAHEALIHRLDAELCAGTVTALDPELAADGVDEALSVMFGGCPDWGTQSPTQTYVRVDCTDTDDQVWVDLVRFSGTSPDGTRYDDEPDIAVVPDPGVEPDALVQGTASALDQWLWHRTDGSDLDTSGTAEVLAAFRSVLSGPIN